MNVEALLVASGQNIKQLLAFGARRQRRKAQAAALRPPRRSSSHTARAKRRFFGRRAVQSEAFCNSLSSSTHFGE